MVVVWYGYGVVDLKDHRIDHLKIKVSQFQKLLTDNFSKFFFDVPPV